MRTELQAFFYYKGYTAGHLDYLDYPDDDDFDLWCHFSYMIDERTHESFPSELLPELVTVLEEIRIMATRIKSISDWFQLVKIETEDYHFEIKQL